MKYTFIIYIIIIFYHLTVNKATAQIDPYCHVEIVSGSPVLFQINTIDEIVNGKQLSYLSVIKVYYFKEPKEWDFCAKSNAQYFDGPSDNFSVQNISITVERVKFGDADIPKNTDDNSFGWSISFEQLLQDGGKLAHGFVTQKDLYTAPYQLEFYVRFSCKPNEWSKLSDMSPGYYASQAIFYMETTYHD